MARVDKVWTGPQWVLFADNGRNPEFTLIQMLFPLTWLMETAGHSSLVEAKTNLLM